MRPNPARSPHSAPRPRWLRYIVLVVAMHAVGIAFLLSKAGRYPQLIGFGFLAYTLGLRHAFDADHIAAIDNTVRKMIERGEESSGVGFFFSLGHSAVVCAMAIVTAFSATLITDHVPQLRAVGGIVSTSVSGVFLILMGLLNLYVWLDIYRSFRKIRRGEVPEEHAHDILTGGFFARLFGPLYRLVSKSWHVFPIGVLFGFSFDTASEIALFSVAATAASQTMPLGVILSLPLLFAAGMSVMDTLDGIFMTTAYDWAFSTPMRKIYYNLSITGLSVAAALFIGVVEIAQLITSKLGLHGGGWSLVQALDFSKLGYLLVALLVACWLVSIGLWKLLRLDATAEVS